MDTKEKIALANQILGNVSPEDVKIVHNDRSLIERKTTSKIVLTEDNRELLAD